MALSELDKSQLLSAKNYLAGIGAAEYGNVGFKTFTTTLDANGVPSAISLTATNVALTRTTTNPLSGNASWSFSKAAANAQGQGVISDVFTVDRRDLAKVLQAVAEYEVTADAANIDVSGTSTQSVEVWVYCVGSNTWIQPSGFRGMNQSVGVGKQVCTFQTEVTNNQYRIALICRQTTATAFTFSFEMSCGPQVTSIGIAASDWQEYTITPTATTTAPTLGATRVQKALWRRVADSVEINFMYHQSSAGSAGSGAYLFNLPPGISIDTTKAPIPTTLPTASGLPMGAGVIGHGYASKTAAGDGANTSWLQGFVYSATQISFVGTAGVVNTGYPFSSGWNCNFASNPLYFSFNVKLPVAGWSSNVQMSSDTDTRVVAARAYATANRTINNTTVCNFDTVDYDTHGAITTGASWNYKAPSAGMYRVSISTFASPTAGTSTAITVNGVVKASLTECGAAGQYSGACVLKLNAGDLVAMRGVQATSATLSYNSNPFGLAIQVDKISGPSVVAASEKIKFKARGSASLAYTGGAAILYPTKEIDSHNAYSTATGLWTAPRAETVLVSAVLQSNGSGTNLSLYKNGVRVDYLFTISGTNVFSAATLVDVIAGDTLSLRADATGALGTSTAANVFCVSSLG